MPTSWSLNGFYNGSQGRSLYEAIPLRESCRVFAAPPEADRWSALQKAAEELALPGTRIVLDSCENSLFQPFGGLLMHFENVQRFAAVIVKDDAPQSVVNAGIGGEMLLLTAVAAGLGGVWVAGTYKRGKLDLALQEGEKVKALIALGVPKDPPKAPLKRNRKPLSQLCSANFENAPAVMREVALAVQSAPSAMNRQPWQMDYREPKEMTIQVKRGMQRLDLGIGLCHAVLALGDTPAVYDLSEDGLCARITL